MDVQTPSSQRAIDLSQLTGPLGSATVSGDPKYMPAASRGAVHCDERSSCLASTTRSFKWPANSRRSGSGHLGQSITLTKAFYSKRRSKKNGSDGWTLAITRRSYKTLTSSLTQRDM